jgi:hypothetical protein
MAAVLALIMVPLLATLGLLALVTHTEATFVAGVAMTTAFALGVFVLINALRLVHDAEEM